MAVPPSVMEDHWDKLVQSQSLLATEDQKFLGGGSGSGLTGSLSLQKQLKMRIAAQSGSSIPGSVLRSGILGPRLSLQSNPAY